MLDDRLGAGDPARAAVHILPVPKSGYVIVVFAGPIRGLNMHWKAGGSVPCLPDDLCPATVHRSGTTWKGFAPVRHWNHALGLWVPWALEVTEAAEELLRGRDLRGECWRFSRQRLKKKAGAVVGVLEEVRAEPELLVPFDVTAVIHRRYHCKDLIWDVPNPIKPKLVIAPTSAAPPSSLPILTFDNKPPCKPAGDQAERVSMLERYKRSSTRNGDHQAEPATTTSENAN